MMATPPIYLMRDTSASIASARMLRCAHYFAAYAMAAGDVFAM